MSPKFCLLCPLRHPLRSNIDEHEHGCDEQYNQCGNRIDARVDPFAHRVNRDAQIFHTAASDKIRNDKIINRHRKCNQCTGDDTRHDLRNDDLRQRPPRCRTEIHRRICKIRIKRTNLRHDREHDIRNTECDMCEQHRHITLLHPERNEQQHKADCRYDLRIHHRKIIDLFHQILHDFL